MVNKKQVNTIIIGAGQAGLSVSYYLTKKRVRHLILEKDRIAEDWRSRRWDNFKLLTPNFMTKLPGFSYKGKNPKGFDGRDEIVKFLEDYAKFFNAPVLENTKVLSITKNKDSFLIKTNKRDFYSRNIAVATGNFHNPKIPDISKSLPKKIFQIHSSQYRNSEQLPRGAVLVVGAGNSGIQIATDLLEEGRKVYLSVGKLRIMPRHYRGKDFIQWAEMLGLLDRRAEETPEEVKNATPPALWGKPETVNLRKLAKNGMQLLGHLARFKGNNFIFTDDLEEDLAKGEAALASFKNSVDQYIKEYKIKAPEEKSGEPINANIKPLEELGANEIKTVIWCTGFKVNYSFVKLPTFDENGFPIHKRGVSKIKGLYFIGFRWLSKYKSFFIFGVDEDAKYISEQIR